MSRAASTTITTSGATSLQGERLSEDTTEKVPQTRTENVSSETSDASVLWVDWDDPGDPMNPKKWVVRLLFVQLATT